MIVPFRIIERQRRRRSIKMWWFDIIRALFQRKILFTLNFFSVLRLNIVIFLHVMTKKITTMRKWKNLILSTKAEQTRENFWITFSTKTLKKEISRLVMIAKEKTKKNAKKNYKTIKENIITTVKRILSKFEMFIKASKTEATSRNETSNWWFDIFEFIIKTLNVYQFEKYQEVHSDSWKKKRKNVLSMIILANLNKNDNNRILFFLYNYEIYVVISSCTKLKVKFKRFKTKQQQRTKNETLKFFLNSNYIINTSIRNLYLSEFSTREIWWNWYKTLNKLVENIKTKEKVRVKWFWHNTHTELKSFWIKIRLIRLSKRER